jgi:hypothetical protein
MAVTCLLWMVVAWMTEPEPTAKLVEFYRRARPLGWWGPIAREAGIPPAGWNPILRGLGIAALGAIMVGAGIIALSSAYVSRWGVVLCALLMGSVAGLAFRRCFVPFVKEFDVPQE